MADKDRLGSDQRQLELDIQQLNLDGVSIDTLRNLIPRDSDGPVPAKEEAISVERGSSAGDFSGMTYEATNADTLTDIVGGRANVDGISGEISLAGYQYGDAIPDSVTNRLRMGEGSGTSLTDSVGSISATLTGSWASGSKYTEGYATSYDGADDHWLTDSAISINGQEFTAVCWLDAVSGLSQYERILSTVSDPSNTVSDGWRIGFFDADPSRYFVAYVEGGSFTDVIADVAGPDASQEDVMVALAGNGDNATLRLYDSNGLHSTHTGSGARGQGDTPLCGMAGGGQYVGGRQDDVTLSTTTELPESDITQIWEATQR